MDAFVAESTESSMQLNDIMTPVSRNKHKQSLLVRASHAVVIYLYDFNRKPLPAVSAPSMVTETDL